MYHQRILLERIIYAVATGTFVLCVNSLATPRLYGKCILSFGLGGGGGGGGDWA